MDASHLDYRQRNALLTRIEAELAFHERLLVRMKEVGWLDSCPLYVNALAARDALAAMRDALAVDVSLTGGEAYQVLKVLGLGWKLKRAKPRYNPKPLNLPDDGSDY